MVDAPRLGRPDRNAEILRRNNAAARIPGLKLIVHAGLSDEAQDAISATLRFKNVIRVSSPKDVDQLPVSSTLSQKFLNWGSENLGAGLLLALRSRRQILFSDAPSPQAYISPRSGHLVICEKDNGIAQVIAANYAYSLRAGLYLIGGISAQMSDELLERLYDLYGDQSASATHKLEAIQKELRALCGEPSADFRSITFVTKALPFGVGFPEVPTTHLFSYPDLGVAIVNGFAAEQPGTTGTSVGVLVDPQHVEAREMETARQLLPLRGMFVRGYSGGGASARAFNQMLELFPYDFLIISTHCGDTTGQRRTYQFVDSAGQARTLVVDVALGLERTDEPELFGATEFFRFVSIDGVDWNDPHKADKIQIGTALQDWIDLIRKDKSFGPSMAERIGRVRGSAALKMHDFEVLPTPRSLANETTPIVINNACASWHRLAGVFTHANARAYIGTLFPVSDTEASEIVTGLLDKYFGEPLAAALWSIQRDVYAGGPRRPYAIVGVYPQLLRVAPSNVPQRIIRQLMAATRFWKSATTRPDYIGNEHRLMYAKDAIQYCTSELEGFLARYGTDHLEQPK